MLKSVGKLLGGFVHHLEGLLHFLDDGLHLLSLFLVAQVIKVLFEG